MARRFTIPVILAALVFSACSRDEVTFYPAYGYRSGTDWRIPIRAWVHEKRSTRGRWIGELAHRKVKCDEREIDTFRDRFVDFPDDDKWNEEVTIQFDSDPDKEQYRVGRSKPDGLVVAELTLPQAKSPKLLEAQKSSKGWLTYHTVSGGQEGEGRIRLIEPEGISVVTDIDDTIKVTEVPSETGNVLRNTFCRDFVTAPGMADSYKGMGDVPFHYVSGGPWQLYGPLNDFLISGPGGYPEGTFHFNYFPKNILAKDALAILVRTLDGPLEGTYQHKVAKITELIERFPGRKFILIGDSGELDPEVYRLIRENHPGKVKEIWIRDVVNDAVVNPDRLEGMKIIKSEPVICAAPDHYRKISEMLKKLNRPAYRRNLLPPCGQQ